MSNLRTSGSDPTYYGLLVSGLTNGLSAKQNYDDGDEEAGVYATTFEDTSELETIYANNFQFSYIDKFDSVTLVGNPAQNGVEAELTITFEIDEPIPKEGSFVIGLP